MSHARRLLIISAPAKNAEAAPGRDHAHSRRGDGRCSTPARAGALTLCLLLPALVGCQRWCKPATVHVPVEVPIERTVYVPIDEHLTTQHHVATGPVSECLAVAAHRGTELRKCNTDKAAIRAVQGGPAEPGEPKPENEDP